MTLHPVELEELERARVRLLVEEKMPSGSFAKINQPCDWCGHRLGDHSERGCGVGACQCSLRPKEVRT